MGYQVSYIRGKEKANDSSVCFGSLGFDKESPDPVNYFFCIPQEAWDKYVILLTDLSTTFDFKWKETEETEGYYTDYDRHLDVNGNIMKYVTITMSDSQFVTRQHRLFVLTWMRLGHEFSELLINWDGKDYNYFFNIKKCNFYEMDYDDYPTGRVFLSPNSDNHQEHFVCSLENPHKEFTSFLDQHEFYIKQKPGARVHSFLEYN